MMIRTFHPIGQGAFYTEEFDNFTFVYDCGTDTDGKKRIGKYVSNHFDINEEINFLFISHFHRDHINGLEYLLSKYTVKRIFIPQYDIYERIIELFNTSNEGDYEKIDINLFDNKLILDPIETIKSISIDTEVTLVRHDYGDSIIEDDINDYEVSPDNYLNSGEMLSSPIPNWIFIPINYKDKFRSHVFSEELKKLNIEFRNTDDFVKAWSRKDKRKNVINTFKDLSYSPNENSMVVYSGPKNEGKNYFLKNIFSQSIPDDDFSFPLLLNINNHAGCIYFGDYEAKNKGALELIKNRLKEYYNSACTIQIPHHGSFENYSENINERHNIYSVISYGERNRHKHPSPCTRKLIEKNAGILFEVTEEPLTILRFFIDER